MSVETEAGSAVVQPAKSLPPRRRGDKPTEAHPNDGTGVGTAVPAPLLLLSPPPSEDRPPYGLKSHQTHQPSHTLTVDLVILMLQPDGHSWNAVGRGYLVQRPLPADSFKSGFSFQRCTVYFSLHFYP